MPWFAVSFHGGGGGRSMPWFAVTFPSGEVHAVVCGKFSWRGGPCRCLR